MKSVFNHRRGFVKKLALVILLVASCTVSAGGMPGGLLLYAMSDQSAAIAKCQSLGLKISGIENGDHTKCLAFLKETKVEVPSWFRPGLTNAARKSVPEK